MWIYRKFTTPVYTGTGAGGYTDVYRVGYLQHILKMDEFEQRFVEVEEYESADKARAAVNYLNGGNSDIEVSGRIAVHE